MGWQENKIKYTNAYNKERYDRIVINVPKGLKGKIKAAAEKIGQSVTAYIVNAIENKMAEGKDERKGRTD